MKQPLSPSSMTAWWRNLAYGWWLRLRERPTRTSGTPVAGGDHRAGGDGTPISASYVSAMQTPADAAKRSCRCRARRWMRSAGTNATSSSSRGTLMWIAAAKARR